MSGLTLLQTATHTLTCDDVHTQPGQTGALTSADTPGKIIRPPGSETPTAVVGIFFARNFFRGTRLRASKPPRPTANLTGPPANF